ncbi:LOW QUALITY PROTEIN: hypothetical protein V2J09_015991 [Rumex salicifolius]
MHKQDADSKLGQGREKNWMPIWFVFVYHVLGEQLKKSRLQVQKTNCNVTMFLLHPSSQGLASALWVEVLHNPLHQEESLQIASLATGRKLLKSSLAPKPPARITSSEVIVASMFTSPEGFRCPEASSFGGVMELSMASSVVLIPCLGTAFTLLLTSSFSKSLISLSENCTSVIQLAKKIGS